ncbi:ABC transporter permease [Lysinibacillus fusiformis]|uniref:ABC transporter permease n=1 Tax=Lysinibacillus fusiformis TaxID=28031 RepID=UPI00380D3FC9
MMPILKIVLASIRNKKVSSAIIFFLTVVITFFSVSSLTMLEKTEQIFEESYSSSNAPDMYYTFDNQYYYDEYANFFQNRKEVANVNQKDNLAISKQVYIHNKSIDESMLEAYRLSENKFQVKTSKNNVQDLKNSEVYIPFLFKQQYKAKEGDKLKIKIGNEEKSYTIAGFFEDPMFGSSIGGIKRIFMTEADFSALSEIDHPVLLKRTSLMVYIKSAYKNDKFDQTLNEINKEFGKDDLGYYLVHSSFKQSSSLVPTIISFVFLVFSAFLAFIVAIVIRHAILSTIEEEYVNFGILKAVGFMSRQILAVVLLQYLTICIIGIVVGLGFSIFMLSQLGNLMLSSTGLFWRDGLNLELVFLIILVLLLFIAFIVYLSARLTKKITPVRAIIYGMAQSKKSASNKGSLVKMSFLPLNFSLPIKQMLSQLKQYLMLILISVVLVFSVLTITNLSMLFDNEEKQNALFGFSDFDLNVRSTNIELVNEQDIEAVVSEIKKEHDVLYSFQNDQKYVKLEGTRMFVDVSNTFKDGYPKPLEGRFPEADNEIVVTPIVKQQFNKKVGDTVQVQMTGGFEKTFTIVGSIQSTMEFGKSVAMLTSGLKRIDPTFISMGTSLKFKSTENVDKTVQQLKKKYQTTGSGMKIDSGQSLTKQVMDPIRNTINIAAQVVYMLAIILVAFISFLLSMIAIQREVLDMAIFKAIGFSSTQLRFQFALRFMFASLVGGIIGAGISFLFSPKLIEIALLATGIARIDTNITLLSIVISVVSTAMVAFVFAFIAAKCVKKLTVRKLMTD